MAITPEVKDSPPQKPLVGLEMLPLDSWVRVAAFVGQKVACCSRVSKCIRDGFITLGATLWHEHHLANFGPVRSDQDWQVRFRESGHSLQMGMRVKIPSIRETGSNISSCVLEGDKLVVAKIDNFMKVISNVTCYDLGRGTTEKHKFTESAVYSLSFQQGVFATISVIIEGYRLNIWRQGADLTSLRSLYLNSQTHCRIDHGKVLLSAMGPFQTSGLSLVDLETGKTTLPFSQNRLKVGEYEIYGAYQREALFIDPHTILAAHPYKHPNSQTGSSRLHVWDVRVGFHQAAAQTYVVPELVCSHLTLNSCGEICTATTDNPQGTGQSFLSLWDTRTSKRFKRVEPKGDMEISALSSMGKVIFSGSKNGIVRCWNPQLKLMDKWVLPNPEKTAVHHITASPSICLFLSQETAVRYKKIDFLSPSTLWQATALTFAPPADAKAAKVAAPSPMAAAGAGAGAASAAAT